jgi:hypothetical protein
MPLFSRSSHRQPFLTASASEIARLGEAAFGGQSVHPPGLNAIPTGQLDGYAMAFLAAAGYPAAGSQQERAANLQFLDELVAAAEHAGGWGFPGALLVAWNCVASAYQLDPRYDRIIEQALETLRNDGVSYTAVPRFAIDRWTAVHGRTGIHPAGWPSALIELPVPAPEQAPRVADLALGERRRLAQPPAAPQNSIYAERRAGGVIQAVVEGVDPDTGGLRAWDWEGLSAPGYPAFLRELGERLVTHSHWAHDDLIPYFPCRRKSREQMRREASQMPI